MYSKTKSALILPLVAGVLVTSTHDALAYIDPGSSSYLFQILIAGFTALVFFFSAIKRKIGQFVYAMTRRKKSPTEQGDEFAAAEATDVVEMR